jgi:hypothetical protein
MRKACLLKRQKPETILLGYRKLQTLDRDSPRFKKFARWLDESYSRILRMDDDQKIMVEGLIQKIKSFNKPEISEWDRSFSSQEQADYTCKHKWVVESTALAGSCLMLKCEHCGKSGTVNDPTGDEWSKAFYAPSNPYEWTGGNDRVLII